MVVQHFEPAGQFRRFSFTHKSPLPAKGRRPALRHAFDFNQVSWQRLIVTMLSVPHFIFCFS